MPELPHGPISIAVYERLTGDDGAGLSLSESDVFFAGAKDVPRTYVAIDLPDAAAQETFDTEGWDVTMTLRCHAEHAKGDRTPLRTFDLASSVKASLDDQPLEIGPDHALLHLPTPDVQKNSYDIDQAHRAFDIVLRYDLLTQHLD